MPFNGLTLIIALVFGTITFAAGWTSSKWKSNSDQKEQLVGDVVEREKRIGELTRDLDVIITKASDASIAVSGRLDGIQTVLQERNNGLEMLAKKTQEIGNEIAKLEPLGCVLTPPYRRMYLQIGEEANGSRNRLYDTGSQNTH